MSQTQIKQLLSKSVYNRLTKTLLSIDVAKTIGERSAAYDKLRDQLAKLFALKYIGQYPNQVMEDFAETLQGLYTERDDLSGYLYHIKNYLYKQVETYERTTAQLTRRAQVARKQTNIDSIEMLDIEYQAWTYTHGYYKQQTDMYRFLLNISEQIILYDSARVKK